MKELSVEEKAKRYDEAIEKFDVILNLNTVKERGTIFADDVRKIFPELAELNDEKIRKALVKYFTSKITNPDYEIYGVPFKEVLAWLEKQSSDISLFSSEQRKYMEKYVSLDKITLIKLLAERDANNAEIIESFEKQGEQKPNPVLDIEIPFGTKDSELQEASYHIPEGFHAEIKGNRVVIKRGEQKPVGFNIGDEITVNGQVCRVVAVDNLDCSKENEMMFDGIIADVEVLKEQSRTKDGKAAYQKEIDWLKSIRPQNTWKPSDEQMDAIDYVKNFDYGGYKDMLVSLYYDLKKLKEG